MRKTIFTLLILLLGTQMKAYDGGDKYKEAMIQTLLMLDTAKTTQTYQNCANRFERIGNAEKKEWMPYYYAGMCYSLMVFMEKDVKKMDDILDRADQMLDIALDKKIKENDKSEILVIRGMICGGRIQVDPQVRAMKYGPLSGQYYNRALNLNPENPRALSMSAQSTMYTPKQFGGGREKAIPMLEEALKKFEAWEEPSEIYPNWGLEIAEGTLEFAKSGEKAPWEEEAPGEEGSVDEGDQGDSEDAGDQGDSEEGSSSEGGGL